MQWIPHVTVKSGEQIIGGLFYGITQKQVKGEILVDWVKS